MRSTPILAAAILLLGLSPAWAVPAQQAGADSADIRQEFKTALQRIAEGSASADGVAPGDSPALKAYVIYDYLVAARLRRALAVAPGDELDKTIDDFLRGHQGQPVARGLRHEWLVSLAGRQRWDWFLPRAADASDAQLVCDRLAGRLLTGDTVGLAQDALARWSMPQRQPDECSAVFAWLRSQELLTPMLAEARTRAALGADNPRLAREFLLDVPPPRSEPLMTWVRLLETPRPVINALLADPAMPVEPDALVAGYTRLSSSDWSAAAALLPALLERPDMTPALQARLRRATALGEAFSRAPGAVAAFAALAAPDVNDIQVLEWRVRAALWTRDFPRALTWMDELPPALAVLPRWRYWRARAVAATLGAEAAVPLYAQIAATRDYYGYLAADKLQQAYNLNIHPTPDDAEQQAALAAEPGLLRAHALFDCDLADDAAAEWAAVLGMAKPVVKVQAAHLASRWGWYAQTITTLAAAGEWDDVPLRYPRPYSALVTEASKRAGVPADWIFAIMRQESLFRKDAVSRADARGLMQMQPATALAVARRWHLSPLNRDSLFEPVTAIDLGAAYIRELLDKYQGHIEQSLAAYNAGPGAVARWLPAEPTEADVWIENIPFAETRGYVQHILEHIVAFAVMRNATPPRLASLLQPVASAPSGAAPP